MKVISPLAEVIRPKSLDEVVGQSHLLGKGQPLRLMFESRHFQSMILWGTPGIGKTTLARLVADSFEGQFISLSAAFAGVKEIRSAMEQAEQALLHHRRTILFIDEIHRFNKSQQDALLPFIESGLIILIGATTENPSFELNSALLSRTQVYVLKTLSEEELKQLFIQVHEKVFQYLEFDEAAINLLINYADGDARRLLNLLEQINTIPSKTKEITFDFIQKILTSSPRRFDKKGDFFYDQISALHKSVRGSNPDASLYWFCRMLDGGADPLYLARRIIRMAWEDIGLADPNAFQIVNNAAQTYERLGSPEGELALAQAVIYLAMAPKSNAAYKAYQQAKAFVNKDKSREVPLHLRNAPTRLGKELGFGRGYRYAHDEDHAYAAGENYWPFGLKPLKWYVPTSRGWEKKILEKMEWLKKLEESKTSSK